MQTTEVSLWLVIITASGVAKKFPFGSTNTRGSRMGTKGKAPVGTCGAKPQKPMSGDFP